MSVKKRQESGTLAGQGAFFVGLALIILATVHNVGFDGMNQVGRLSLPSFLAETYAATGKLGVTLFLVGLGVGVMLLGLLIDYLSTPRRAKGWQAPEHLAPSPNWSSTGSSSTLGSVQLDTQKYLDPYYRSAT
jgi:hypothetical protein